MLSACILFTDIKLRKRVHARQKPRWWLSLHRLPPPSLPHLLPTWCSVTAQLREQPLVLSNHVPSTRLSTCQWPEVGRGGDESDVHLSGDVISIEPWWAAPAVSVHWATDCSTCLKPILQHRTGTFVIRPPLLPPLMKSMQVEQAGGCITNRARFHVERARGKNAYISINLKSRVTGLQLLPMTSFLLHTYGSSIWC